MTTRTLGFSIYFGSIFWIASLAFAQSGPPAIFFSDLESGPNTGGENGLGAYVTLYGKNFGTQKGTVTVGGGPVDNYPIWTDSRISFQLGSATATGGIVVTNSAGSSNSVPFTVRPGNIYFVSNAGTDSAAGTFEDPWRTLLKARDTMEAGDITYAMDGVSQTVRDGSSYNAAMTIRTSGAEDRPKALVAYPGATVTIGDETSISGIRIVPPASRRPTNHWVFAGLELRGLNSAFGFDTSLGPSTGFRVVANDISCPSGDGQTGCFSTSFASNVSFLGNVVHDTAIYSNVSKQYHAVYFSTDSNHIEVGWNIIRDNDTCRAVQFHSSPIGAGTGHNQYDLIVHDNLIYGSKCDGINFATVDPSRGPVEAYNNIIHSVGRGPDPRDGASNYACIYFPGTVNAGPSPAGLAEVYNNTLYNCGARPGSNGAIGRINGQAPNVALSLRNNIVRQFSGEPYLERNTTQVTGTNNLWFGSSDHSPSGFSNNIDGDALFVDQDSFDFHLLSGSPAAYNGVNTGIDTDKDGLPRPQGPEYSIGAFELPGS